MDVGGDAAGVPAGVATCAPVAIGPINTQSSVSNATTIHLTGFMTVIEPSLRPRIVMNVSIGRGFRIFSAGTSGVEMRRFADRIVVMEDGAVAAQASWYQWPSAAPRQWGQESFVPRAYRQYFREIYDLIEEMLGAQARQIETAASWMADAIAQQGGVVHLFGSGHSHMIAEEVFHRAGSLMPFNPMLDPNLTLFGMVNATLLERTSGYGAVVINTHDIRPGEVGIVASQSGVNPGPIEVALAAKERGARTIAITADRTYADAPSRHSSGKRLADVTDLTLDTGVPRGDAVVTLPGVEAPVGGASSVLGIALINALVVETADVLRQRGIEPPVIPSMNLPGGDERMEELTARYRDRLPLLRRA
jgi:uncharacterized phosphosugar-binding protein